jgi:hypothetical protein
MRSSRYAPCALALLTLSLLVAQPVNAAWTEQAGPVAPGLLNINYFTPNGPTATPGLFNPLPPAESQVLGGGNPILSNLPATPTTTGTNLGLGTDLANRAKAVGLTMGSSAMEFDSMVALISNGTPASTLSGGIFSNVGGNPGLLLAAFTDVPVAASAAVSQVAVTTAAPFTLQANTSYWFVLDGPNTTNSLLWNSITPNTAPTAVVGVTFLGYRFSSNNNVTWANSTTFNGVTINAIVPEPGTITVLAGSILLVLRRRR